MTSSAMGATAFQKGLGATNAVCMLAVLQFNKSAVNEKLASAANYLNIKGGFEGFCDFVDQLNASLGIPKSLTELGIKDMDIDRVVDGAISDPSAGGNPTKLTRENKKNYYYLTVR
jgi:alcohol dehydrogenase class IV